MGFEDLTFSYSIGLGYVIGKREDTIHISSHFEEEEWNSMSDKEKEDWLDEYLETELQNYLTANIWIDD